MANPEKSKKAKTPSRAASLQRMLEIERKQKMERLQLQNSSPAPSPGRRGQSPASNHSSASSGSKPTLLHRRRDSSTTRQQVNENEDRRMPTVRNFTLPPLSIHTQPTQPISLTQDRPRPAADRRSASPVMEKRKTFDRDNLPSMVKANATHEPSNLKMVTFAPADDAEESDDSSICHSPTWDDYGKKKRKDIEGRKRLTKEPPPAAMDNRPGLGLYGRAMTDTVLNNQRTRQSVEYMHSSQEQSLVQTEVTAPAAVDAAETVTRSPAFIGGVRLERERDAALKRRMDARTPSQERSTSEMSQYLSDASTKTEKAKKRETAPAEVSYPPTASKTFFLNKQSGPSPRPRRGSFGQDLMNAAGKLFKSSRDKDAQPFQNKRNESQESVQTVQAVQQERGRPKGGLGTHTRGSSYDSHTPLGTPKEERRSMMPPLAWKNMRKNKTTSMIAVPPDSARDGPFTPDSAASSSAKQDRLSFLERPFSPPVDSPLSPVGSLSASMKARMSPALTPTAVSSPSPTAVVEQAAPQKKTFKQALKAGFRSSSANPENRKSRPRSGTNDTLVGTDTEVVLSRDSHPLQSHPLGGQPAKGRVSSGQQPHQHTSSSVGQPHPTVGPKDSGASSSSSHPDTESLPPSPMTTPETSRPQSSSKDTNAHNFRIEDARKVSIPSTQDTPRVTMRHLSAEQAPSLHTKLDPPRIKYNQEAPSPKFSRPRGRSGSNFIEDLPSTSPPFLHLDDLWTRGSGSLASGKKPVDPDQLSFTSALTSIDVKRSFNDLNATVAEQQPARAVQAPNADVTPLSLDSDGLNKRPKQSKQPIGSRDVSSRSSQTHLKAPNGRSSAQGGGFKLPSSIKSVDTLRSPPSSFSDAPPGLRTDSPAFSCPSPSTSAFQFQGAPRKVSLPTPTTGSPRVVPTLANRVSTASTGSLPLTAAGSATRAFALTNTGGGAGMKKSSLVSSAAPGAPVVVNPSIPTPSTVKGVDPLLNKPIAKMLVECCHCRFYQDMPSRVYEAMARPDDVVKDKRLGVSGAVTTCVKCPWCSHNMSTTCCAGYAAVVYLREKLHGPA